MVIEKFSGIINNINGEIINISLYDSKGCESFIEASADDMTQAGILCKPGTVFHFFLKKDEDKETTEFKKIDQPKINKEEFDKLLKFYQEKYKNI